MRARKSSDAQQDRPCDWGRLAIPSILMGSLRLGIRLWVQSLADPPLVKEPPLLALKSKQ